jgi:protein phosphatase
METLAKLCREDPQLLMATTQKVVNVTDPASKAEGINWWMKLTKRGGEGMVVKPLDFILRGKRGLAQPAVKCRGREYLRIIYGPDYTTSENLDRKMSWPRVFADHLRSGLHDKRKSGAASGTGVEP